MRLSAWAVGVAACLLGSPSADAASTGAYVRVAVYYDAHTNAFNYGKLYVNELRNLLGHFKTHVSWRDVAAYAAGDMDAQDVSIYIGSWFREPPNLLPAPFLADAAAPGRRLLWMNYNVWELLLGTNDVSHLGLSYSYRILTGYDRVEYKGETLFRYTNYTETVVLDVTNSAAVKIHATAFSSTDGLFDPVPYAVQSSNFWYVADNPLSYDTDISRSLVLADLLHDILGTSTPTNHRALVRIEDINPGFSDTGRLVVVAGLLGDRGIRAAFGIIPRYVDPLAQGEDLADVVMAEDRSFLRALQECQRLGAYIVQHGYTHHNDEESLASGDGYEFWNSGEGRPLLADGTSWALGRVDAGIAEILRAGFRNRIWETPHYVASLATYPAIAARYAQSYERLRAFNDFADGLDVAGIDSLSRSNPVYATQYLPYTTFRSTWGTIFLPENLQFYNPAVHDSFGLPLNVSNKVMYAGQLRVVRDAVASFYFHIEDEPSIVTDIVHRVEQLGYTFTDIDTLLKEGPAE
jgi:uncharacterized protein YdaL